MKKRWMLTGLLLLATLAGCSPDQPEKKVENKEISVTVDTQKTIQTEIGKLKKNLSKVPVAHIEGASRGAVTIETEIGTEKPITTLMATDIVAREDKKILIQYMVSNQPSQLNERYTKRIPDTNGKYLTDETGRNIAWEKDGWSFEVIPSEQTPSEQLVSWAESFEGDKELVNQVSKWFSLDDVKLIKDVPGDNVRFYVGVSTMNPEHKDILHIPNTLYAMIQTDIQNVSKYQINHSVVPIDTFDFSLIDSFKKIEAGNKKAWYKEKTKELYWQDEHFIYHLQDNALQVNADFFDLEDYKKFANLQ